MRTLGRTNVLWVVLTATAATLGILLPLAAWAAGAAHAAKKAAKPQAAVIVYRAQCGMTYTAAEARKGDYVCPMDHKKWLPFIRSPASATVTASPADSIGLVSLRASAK